MIYPDGQNDTDCVKSMGPAMVRDDELDQDLPAEQKMLGSARDWLRGEKDAFAAKTEAVRDTLRRLNTDDDSDPEGWRQRFVEAVAMYKAVKANWARLQSFEGADQVKLLSKKLNAISPQTSGALLSDFVDELQTMPRDFVYLTEKYNAIRRRFAHDRIVFVDLETSFSNFRFWAGVHQAAYPSSKPENDGDLRLDPSSVGLLVRLCTKANAKLVLTSSWRKSWPDGRDALVKALIGQGLTRDIWHPEWMLPVSPVNCKWHELSKWINWSSNSLALVIAGERPPADAPPLLAKKAALLMIDVLDGFGGRDYFRALEFFDAEDADTRFPPKSSETSIMERYPTLLMPRHASQ